jgi:hypothetical protein
MPATAQEITDAGKTSLDWFIANNPIDQIAVDRPLYSALNQRKTSAPGGKQYIVEQLRVRYGSNFQWFAGATVVTYNRRQPIEQAQYAWRSAHDGFAIDEDTLLRNGISVDDDGPGGNLSRAEAVQLTNVFKEHSMALRNGMVEKFSAALMLDGTQSSDAVTGLDALVSLTPTTGTVGGINRATASNAFWRNYAQTGLTTTTTTGTILDYLEIAYRACTRNGGRPTHIFAGDDFIDGYRNFLFKSFGRLDFNGSTERVIEGGTSGLKFHGIDIQWMPEFDDLDTLYAPTPTWSKRCYILNLNNIRLRPLEGQDMISRKPPRAYDKYEHYFALTWRGALTMNRANSQAVVSIS